MNNPKESFAALFGQAESIKPQPLANNLHKKKILQSAKIAAQNSEEEEKNTQTIKTEFAPNSFAALLGELITPLRQKAETSPDFQSKKTLSINISQEEIEQELSPAQNSFANLLGDVEILKSKNCQNNLKTQNKTLQINRINAQNTRNVQKREYPSNFAQNFHSIPESIIRAMRQGKIKAQREFDLHGLFMDDAVNLINNALNERDNRQSQYWLIIHGKGNNSPDFDKAPVKNAVIDTLRAQPAIGAIVAVQDSNNESGAVMVLVAKKEQEIRTGKGRKFRN